MYKALGFVEVLKGQKNLLPDLIDMELDLASFATNQGGTQESGRA